MLKGNDKFDIAQLKLMEGGGRQEAGKTWPWKALLVHEEIGLYLRNHLPNVRCFQMGSSKNRFVFCPDFSGE